MLGSPPSRKGIRYDRQPIQPSNPLRHIRRNRNLCQHSSSNGSLKHDPIETGLPHSNLSVRLCRLLRNLLGFVGDDSGLTVLAPPPLEPHARSAWGFFVPKSSDFMIVPESISGKRMADVKKLKCRVGLCKTYNGAFLRVVSNVIL